MTTALLIFALTYVVVAGQRLPFVLVDRPAAALLGAVAMVATGVLTLPEAYAAIHMDTIVLLLGVMILAAYLSEAGFFRATAYVVLTRAGSARSLLWALVFVAGLLSALLVNDTVCMMFTPLVLAVVVEAELPALPFLLALATASNVGGMITYTGNPQNMIIGSAHGAPSYLSYTLRALPAGLLALTVDAAVIQWLFRRDLPEGRLRDRAPPKPHVNKALTIKALVMLGLFVVLAVSGRPLAGAAMTAAGLLILAARTLPRQALQRVDWVLLLFFAGLFVVVRGVEKSGALERAFEPLAPLLRRGDAGGLLAFAGITVVASNVISNVPFVLVAVHWIKDVPEPALAFTVLAYAATLAGNLTIFGSVANLIVFETAGPRAQVGFVRFLRYGAVVTLATLTVALGVLFLQRFVGWGP